MLEEIIRELPFPVAETYFLQPPGGVHAIYGDRISADGSDFDNEIRTHYITLELYEPLTGQSPSAHAALQEALDSNGIPWNKSERMWFADERLLCTTYTFNYTERR